MALGSMDILTVLILPIHEYEIAFHLFVSSLISCINVLKFCFIPKYFIIFGIINGIILFLFQIA